MGMLSSEWHDATSAVGEDAQHTSAYVSICMLLHACIGEDALIGAAGVLHELS